MKRMVIIIAALILLTSCVTQAGQTQGLTLQQQLFLEDMDYMLHTLENNFSLFDVANWARGVDIYAIVDGIKEYILTNPDIEADGFFNVLYARFSPLSPIGHFSIMVPAEHHSIITNRRSWHWNFFISSATNRLSLPHVMEFYEPRHPNNSDDSSFQVNYFEHMTDEGIQSMTDLFYEMFRLYGEKDLAEETVCALRDRDFDKFLLLVELFNERIAETPNVSTEIIEEGKIAYLSINSFWNYPAPASESGHIRRFYSEIQDFDHLIVDLRRNGGGSPWYFYDNVVSVNTTETHVLDAFVFLSDGEYTAELAKFMRYGFLLNNVSWIGSIDNAYRAVDDILESYDLPELNIADMERMDYGFRVQTTIRPSRGLAPPFTGQIWLLTGPLMTSAAQLSAWAAKETGFATLVGELTGGAYGGTRTYAALPNSGIIFQMDLHYVTDINGRPLEAGTIPHYYNMDGMDALETVIWMIENGE